MVATAGAEIAVGLTFITGRYLRVAVWLLTFMLLGVLSPLVVLTSRLFAGPHHAPTLEGQYVLKDVVLVAAGMVVSSTVRGGHLVRGARSAKPTDGGRDQRFSASEKLVIVVDAVRHDRDVDEVSRRHGIEPEDFRRWRDEFLDGAEAGLAEAGATAPSGG